MSEINLEMWVLWQKWSTFIHLQRPQHAVIVFSHMPIPAIRTVLLCRWRLSLLCSQFSCFPDQSPIYSSLVHTCLFTGWGWHFMGIFIEDDPAEQYNEGYFSLMASHMLPAWTAPWRRCIKWKRETQTEVEMAISGRNAVWKWTKISSYEQADKSDFRGFSPF